METIKDFTEDNELIARFMGFKKGFEINNSKWSDDWFDEYDYRVGSVFYHFEWNWLMSVVIKLESIGYFMVSAPFFDDETNKLSGEHFCIVQYKSSNINNGDYIIDITGCSDKFEAMYKACVETIKYINKSL